MWGRGGSWERVNNRLSLISPRFFSPTSPCHANSLLPSLTHSFLHSLTQAPEYVAKVCDQTLKRSSKTSGNDDTLMDNLKEIVRRVFFVSLARSHVPSRPAHSTRCPFSPAVLRTGDGVSVFAGQRRFPKVLFPPPCAPPHPADFCLGGGVCLDCLCVCYRVAD